MGAEENTVKYEAANVFFWQIFLMVSCIHQTLEGIFLPKVILETV